MEPEDDGAGPENPVLGPPIEGVAVDLNAVLLRHTITCPLEAVADTVEADQTTRWYTLNEEGNFAECAEPPSDADVSLLIRTPISREPAWRVLLRQQFGIDGLAGAPSMSSGAVLFVRTTAGGKEQLVAWCFGQGSRWIHRQATSPRFGLLAALNAIAGSASDTVGVTGASLAARDGNLRRASLTAALPTTADAIPRIDTLADVLIAARVRTGHDVLGNVSAGRSLQFPEIISSVADFRRLSGLIVGLAGQDGYRRAHGWIDYIVPETDNSVIEAVMQRIWDGTDEQGQPIDVAIAWWEDLRETGSDHPVTHWRLAGERTQRNSVRNLALTWPGVRSQLRRRLGSVPGHVALGTEIRFFSATEQELGRCPVAELLTAELTIDGITYVLVDGEVCRADADFLKALDAELQGRLVPSSLVPYKPGEHEDDYNARAAEATGMLLLDKADIRPAGMTQIEPCDLLGIDGTLCHVKRHTSATGISHIVSQAVASATVLLRRAESRHKLAVLIDGGPWDAAVKKRVKARLRRIGTSATRLPVIIAVVGEWRNPTIKSLSLLSRLALRTAVQKLSDLGYPVKIMLVAPHSTNLGTAAN